MKVIQMVPENCIGIVLECGYVPPCRELVDKHNRFEMPARLNVKVEEAYHPTFRFSMISQLKNATKLPIIVRGIQSAEDARTAVKFGASAVWIVASTFESDPSPISIVKAVKLSVGQIPVFLTGGIRRGTDVLKAIALGADAVFLDPETPLWGLNLDGKAGLKRMVEMVVDELKLAMVLTHCVNVQAITEKQVVHWVSKL